MLDKFHKNPPLDTRADNNQYTCGSIYCHNVVIVSLPLWQNGVVSASHIVNPLTQTFPNLRATLLIGVAGGIQCENPNEDPFSMTYLNALRPTFVPRHIWVT